MRTILIFIAFAGIFHCTLQGQNLKKVSRKISKIQIVDETDPITERRNLKTWPPRGIVSSKKGGLFELDMFYFNGVVIDSIPGLLFTAQTNSSNCPDYKDLKLIVKYKSGDIEEFPLHSKVSFDCVSVNPVTRWSISTIFVLAENIDKKDKIEYRYKNIINNPISLIRFNSSPNIDFYMSAEDDLIFRGILKKMIEYK